MREGAWFLPAARRRGGGPPEGWWRGKILDLAIYPSTMLRMVPLPIARNGEEP
jgi:hypothetical protein